MEKEGTDFARVSWKGHALPFTGGTFSGFENSEN
jgi:hypothetical protein